MSNVSFVSVSAGTLTHTCIFPQSSVAFMVIPVAEALTQCPPKEISEIEKQLSQTLTKFSELHQRCYVLLCAPLLGKSEQQLLMLLQQRFLSRNLHFLPVHNANECTECMISIARVMCKPLCTVIQERMGNVQEQFLKEEKLLDVIQQIGAGEHESLLLLDGCGSLSNIAKSSVCDLLECGLDTPSAQKLYAALHSQ